MIGSVASLANDLVTSDLASLSSTVANFADTVHEMTCQASTDQANYPNKYVYDIAAAASLAKAIATEMAAYSPSSDDAPIAPIVTGEGEEREGHVDGDAQVKGELESEGEPASAAGTGRALLQQVQHLTGEGGMLFETLKYTEEFVETNTESYDEWDTLACNCYSLSTWLGKVRRLTSRR